MYRKYLFNWSMFYCYVGLPEYIKTNIPTLSPIIHDSVENYPKWNESIILEIHSFSNEQWLWDDMVYLKVCIYYLGTQYHDTPILGWRVIHRRYLKDFHRVPTMHRRPTPCCYAPSSTGHGPPLHEGLALVEDGEETSFQNESFFVDFLLKDSIFGAPIGEDTSF